MKVVPERLDALPLSRVERLFVALAKDQLTPDDLLLVGINPFARIGYRCHAIASTRGLLIAQVFEIGDVADFLAMLDTLVSRLETMRGMLMAKLWQKDALLRPDGELRFPVSFRFAFPQIRLNALPELPLEQKLFLSRSCLFYDDFQALAQDGEATLAGLIGGGGGSARANAAVPTASIAGRAASDGAQDGSAAIAPTNDQMSGDPLTTADLDLVLHSIAPEYTIPRPIPPSRNGFLEPHAGIARVHRLDDAQIQNLCLIESGHYIMLAEAGSSKSALLVSACLRQASLHPDRRFLLLCYNRNLQRFFQWQLDIAGYGARNIHCTTFHKLCADLLDKNGIRWRRRFPSHEEADDAAANAAFQAVLRGDIADDFFGIFIDEVQVFRQEWYKMCYRLLSVHKAGAQASGDEGMGGNDGIGGNVGTGGNAGISGNAAAAYDASGSTGTGRDMGANAAAANDASGSTGTGRDMGANAASNPSANPDPSQYLFVISGDRTQTLENRMRGGRAPWQGDRSFPSYRGRSLRLNRNYRNTAEIASYVESFLSLAHESCRQMGIEQEMPRQDERFRSLSFRHGNPPRLKLLSLKSTESEAETILAEIRRMREGGIDLEEIAVLLFHLQYGRRLAGWQEGVYAIEAVLTARLAEEGIPYSRFYGEDRAAYGRHSGVSLLTFDGALGLDYRGVIVAGMRAMGAYHGTKTVEGIVGAGAKEHAVINYLQNVNAIAVACTRARDELSIVLPEEYGDSVYVRLLVDAGLR